MQNLDTRNGEPSSNWPEPETPTEDSRGQHERWPLDHSKNGYGRPDPDEFGLTPLEAQLNPDSAGRENSARLEARAQPEVGPVVEQEVDNLVRSSPAQTGSTLGTKLHPPPNEPRHPTTTGFSSSDRWDSIAESESGGDHQQPSARDQGRWLQKDQGAGEGELVPAVGTELVRGHGTESRPDLGWNEHHSFDPSPTAGSDRPDRSQVATDDFRIETLSVHPVAPALKVADEVDHPLSKESSTSFELDRGRTDGDDPAEGVASGWPISEGLIENEAGLDQLGELDDSLLVPVPRIQPGAGRSAATASLARSAKTEKEYDKRARMIWRRSVERRTTDPEQPAIVSPVDVTQDLIVDRSRLLWSDATWTLYRSAMLWHLAPRRHTSDAYEQAYQLLSAAKASCAAPREKKPKKKKSISEKHLNQLIDTLGAMNRHVKWGARAQFWLQAGLASGLRPGEWLGASWLDEKKQILCVPNSKRKTTVSIYSVVSPGQTIHDVEADNPERLAPGSLSDESKRIRNVPIKPKDSFWVSVHLANLNAYLDKVPEEEREDRFATYYHTCRKYVHKACVRAFGGEHQYSLYTMRSQYAANMKAEMPLVDVSEFMGHEASGKTTKKDYGPRSAAHGGRGKLTPLEKQARADAQADRSAAAAAARSLTHRTPDDSAE